MTKHILPALILLTTGATAANAQSARQGQFLDERQLPIALDLNLRKPLDTHKDVAGSSMRKSASTSSVTTAKVAAPEKHTALAIKAGIDTGYSTNVFRTKTNPVSDLLVTPSFGVELKSIPAADGSLSFGIGVGVSFDRYSRPDVASEGDSDTIGGAVGLG